MSRSAPAKTVSATRSADLYRAVWRWHFYAGLLVLPFMITLAITGALYLFRDEIDGIMHRDLLRVAVVEGVERVAPETMVASALAAVPGQAVKYTDPRIENASAEITVAADDGARRAVYVDPYTGNVLGSLPDRGTVAWTIRYLHSLKFFGTVARGAIEIAAGWSILLVATGIYLWWPRRAGLGGVLTVRGAPRNRMFWRDTHAVLGIVVGSVIVFLAITGMPWSNVWGGKVNEWANGNNYGYPDGVRVNVPMSQEKLADKGLTSWSLEQAQVPQSAVPTTEHNHAEHDHGQPMAAPAPSDGAFATSDIGLNSAVATFEKLGLHSGFAVSIPSTPTGVFTGSVYPDDLSQQRVVHLDRYSGNPLLDMRYTDYGPLGRWLEFGINVHMGQEFGLANQLFLLAACMGIILLAVSAGIMWWKRRPAGSLGVPAMPSDPKIFRGLIALLAIGGIIFPLVGLSLIVMLAFDLLVMRSIPNRGMA
ncbi:PepSY domain-containing protein [Tianweitania sp. BSSL-BM11]|uniref:PepSY domain-containing protein n=1 Tax=Tianweitania aestuarii TaxID=2814886 RepID=A0ABS5RX11_9HYPH|nr:PepSY domain-containing protein [Tianweitania aestuarii]MBS9720842.1 PepSY domain-containing protein [Tianweitania aestuarii]